MADATSQALLDRLRAVSPEARKLFCVVVREAYHGPMHPKAPGVAVPAEILEACGLDVAEFYSLLASLKNGRLIEVSGDYPFEEIRLTAEASAAETVAERCTKASVPFEDVFVDLDARSLA
jgi:hypothetical protein